MIRPVWTAEAAGGQDPTASTLTAVAPPRQPGPPPGRSGDGRAATERAFAVLDLVDAIPAGRVMTYGDIARHLGLGSPRQVGQILAHRGHEVPWHRVVMADGSPAPTQPSEQLARLRADGTPLRGRRVALDRARWEPPTRRPGGSRRPPRGS